MNTAKSRGKRAALVLMIGALTFGLLLTSCSVARASQDGKALIDAFEDQGLGAVVALVHSGANINAANAGDGTVLMVAAKRGDLPAVDRLLALGADVNVTSHGDGTALIVAAGGGHLGVVKRLMSAGASVEAAVPGDETALITASRKGRLDIVKYLVVQHADVNHGVTTPHGQWRTPLNQAQTPAIRNFLTAHGARTGRS